MRTYEEELKHFINAVDSADYSKLPYEHCYINNIFSDEVYDEILKNLPHDEDYYYMKHPDLSDYGKESPRLRIELNSNYVSTLPEGHVYRLVTKILHSKELKALFFDKFKDTLVKSNRHKLQCSPQPCFMRDKTSYKIKPHPDSLGKIVTFQIYLPEDNSHENVGTIVNTDKGHGSSERFPIYKQFKFHRNTAYAFPVSKTSWHSVNTLVDEEIDRNSLMSIYYHKRPDSSSWTT